MAVANKLLMKKLSIQPERRIVILNPPEGFLDLLSHSSGQKTGHSCGPIPKARLRANSARTKKLKNSQRSFPILHSIIELPDI
jgi:hypothetical protein